MHLEVALQIREIDELREPARRGRLQLSAPLAQLGQDPRHLERREQFLLGGAGDARALAATLSLAEDAVLADLEPAPLGELSDADVVLLGAGEVMDGGAPRLRRDHPQVHLEPGAQHQRAPRAPGHLHARGPGEGGEVRDHQAFVSLGACEQVHVGDGLGAPAQAPATSSSSSPGASSIQERIPTSSRSALARSARASRVARLHDRLQQLGRSRGAKAAHAGDAPVPDRLLQLGDRADAERLPERGGLARSEPRDLGELEEPAREAPPRLLEGGESAGLDQLAQVVGDARPDAGEGGRVLSPTDHRRDALRQALHRAGGRAVRTDLEAIRPAQLEQVGDVVQRGGQLGVLHPQPIRTPASPSSATKAASSSVATPSSTAFSYLEPGSSPTTT